MREERKELSVRCNNHPNSTVIKPNTDIREKCLHSPFFGFFDAISNEVANYNRSLSRVPGSSAVETKHGKKDTTDWFTNARIIPPVDVLEREKDYEVHLSVPGIVDQDKINIEFHSDRGELVISGEVPTSEAEENKNRWRVRERATGSFRRVIGLPDKPGVDSERITADYRHGILTLRVPKLEPRESLTVCRIQIGRGSSK
ncbi:AFR437Wp [Eremothecium gossypii ATCC 10895]|uniref:AFR437Wp n=1 Tax=Eremothecium gossypii (strain ATCC 10895 / CBS 109.51 / FGSC 9923 / NRRL Y-1056) TaxID=284811 RepID=Q752Z6_EREGS|nr:AFR437Wp [Eremothecium gossypii ATCC 10895]AAS53808.1 AFR437Wp [Eremothecium gossypii ATCC 10895]